MADDTHPTITVIIPVYNVARYLGKCLDSVTGQTYRNLEIIVIDDGSDDGSGAICDAYAKRDARIAVIHQENRGLSEARNAGLDIMTGRLVGFVDPDDWLEPDFYERLENGMKKTGADIAVTGYYCVYQSGRYPCKGHKGRRILIGNDRILRLQQPGIGHAVWNKLYDGALWKEIRFPGGRVFEDVLITWQVFLKAEKVVYLEGCSYNHIIRKSSICQTDALRSQSFIAHLETYKSMKKLEKERRLPFGLADVYLGSTAVKAFQILYQYPKETSSWERKKAAEFLRHNRKKIKEAGGRYFLMCSFPHLAAAYLNLKEMGKRLVRLAGYKKLFE